MLLVLALVLAGLFHYRTSTPTAERGPIVVGLIHALSGPTARGEASQIAAARLAVEEINAAGGLLGRRVELRVEDSRGDGRAAAAAAERLITGERVVALFGCGAPQCRQAVRPVVEAHRHLLFYPAAYEGLESSPHIVYTGPTPNQQALPAVDWAMRGFGRRVYVIGTEGAAARRLGALLGDFIQLQGGKLLGERYLPPGGRDVGAIMADLMMLQPELVVSTVAGDSNEALFDALVTAGLTDLPLLSLGAAEPEMRAYEKGRLDRHFTAWGYLQSLPGEANTSFIARLRRSQGDGVEASDPAVSTYVGFQLWAAAVREVGSARTDAVNANVVHQSVTAPQGFAAVEGQTRHLWRQLHIAQVKPGGQLAEVYRLPRYIRPEPWPTFRSTEHWTAVMSRVGVQP